MPVVPKAFLLRAVLTAGMLAQGQPAPALAQGWWQPVEAPGRDSETGEELKQALAPKPLPEALRKQKLDALLARLREALTPEEAQQIAVSIERLWLQTPSDTAGLLMRRAAASVDAQKFPLALEILDKLVLVEPDWAEAWNERASIKLMTGDLDGAWVDFNEAIRREPRHFGALTGMGLILERQGFGERAREVFLKALTIYPLAPEIQKHIEGLMPKAEGKDI